MKKQLLLSLIFLQAALINAQTFSSGSVNVHIKDTGTVCIPITVAGLQTRIDTSFGIISSCFNIDNSTVSNLSVHLNPPTGADILLFDGIGGSGQYFTNTCLAQDGSAGDISFGNSPFTGTYVPQQSLNLLNNAQNPNGTWNFCVSDTYFNDTGTVFNCNITFGVHPPKTPLHPLRFVRFVLVRTVPVHATFFPT